jgi:hypothetical protein
VDATSVYYGRRLLEIIREKQAEMSKPLLQGQAIDYPDYMKRAGELKAYAQVIDWMDQIRMEDERTHVGTL